VITNPIQKYKEAPAMAKIARAAGTENQAVGKVFILYGTVKAV
jgi:hypothetical protein